MRILDEQENGNFRLRNQTLRRLHPISIAIAIALPTPTKHRLRLLNRRRR
jgi:hypothetical protein